MRVSGLARLLITLPLLALPAMSLGLQPALAARTAAEQALRIIVRAKTIESRCRFLSDAERSELSRYAARAEIAAASQSSSTTAKRATAAGRAEGRGVSCSTTARADVRETLYAAREAIAAAEKSRPGRASNASRTASNPAVDDRMQDQDAEAGRHGGDLGRYDRVVRSYYLERQCRSLSKAKDDRFWRGIARLHKAVVARHGAAAVAPLMHKAERRAKRSACGATALAEIRQGYEETMSR